MNNKLQEFLDEWNDERETMTVHTSGSTGKPKRMEVEKRRMLASAKMTCDFLDLREGDTALLCMPLDYIAGKMVVVRSIVRGLRLVCIEPSSRPLQDILPSEAPTFAAMVPMQVYETLRHEPDRTTLQHIRHLIIGGGAIDKELEQELIKLSESTDTNDTAKNTLNIWHSYGMTETLSHIALRRITEPYFRPLPGITISQDADRCLIIDAPHLCAETLHTHDIVEMHDHMFRILGRLDNIVCSGGIKIQIEEVEALLRPMFGDSIQLTSAPHPKYGEELVMLTTKNINTAELKACLPNPYWMPRRIIMVCSLPKTETGKPDRSKAKILAKNGGKN